MATTMVMFGLTICSGQAKLCLSILHYQHPSHQTCTILMFRVQRVTFYSR